MPLTNEIPIRITVLDDAGNEGFEMHSIAYLDMPNLGNVYLVPELRSPEWPFPDGVTLTELRIYHAETGELLRSIGIQLDGVEA